MNQHQCYFHKSQKIIKFCQNADCTLPLCITCEEIHNDQHQKNGTKPDIITFLNAHSKAISELQTKVQRYQSNKKSIEEALNKQKQSLIEFITNIYNQKLEKIQTQFKKLQEYNARLTKIKKGSLKTLILFYSDPLSEIDMKLYDDFIETHNFSWLKTVKDQIQKLINTKKSNEKSFLNSQKQNKQDNRMSFKVQNKPESKRQFERENRFSNNTSPIGRDYEYKVDRIDKNRKSIFDTSTNKNFDTSLNKYDIQNGQTKNEYKPKFSENYPYHEIRRPETAIIEYSQDQLIAKYSGKNKLPSEHNSFGNEMKFDNVIIDDNKKQRYQRSQNFDYDIKYKNNPYVSSALNLKDLNSQYNFEGISSKNEPKMFEKNAFINNQKEQYDYVPKFSMGNWSKPIQRQNNLLNFQNRFQKDPDDKKRSLSSYNKKQLPEQKKITVSDLDQKYHYQKFKAYSHLDSHLTTTPNVPLQTNYNKQSLGAFDYQKLSQQVLSPEQIRKMLEKRIEERNKIMETKATPKVYGQQRSPYKGYEAQIMKYKRQNNAKDSFINQIYRSDKYD